METKPADAIARRLPSILHQIGESGWVMRHMLYRLGTSVVVAALTGCGGDNGGPNGPDNPDPLVVAKAPAPNGDGQTGVVGAPLAEQLRVVLTRAGEPEAGVQVSWTASGTGSISGGTSDASGIATAVWTLPEQAGNATATATVAGATGSPVNFTATANAAAAASLELAGGNNQTGDVDAALPTALQVRAEDQFGNPVAGVTVEWAVTAGGGSVNPASSSTAATGIASSAFTLGPDAGANTATASATGLTGSPVTFTATGEVNVPTPTSAVTVNNDFFNPEDIVVTAGTEVTWTWTNTGGTSHSVQSTGTPSFPSSQILTGNGMTYSFQFDTPGVYTYQCAVHGAAMSGSVTVQ
jgi:plastocyanin